jgi:hypothetical protein
MPRRVLVLATETVSPDQIESAIRTHAGADAEIRVVAPASKISWLDWLTNAEDDSRAEAAQRAGEVTDAVPADDVQGRVGDADPVQAVEDALRTFPADEVVIVTAPDQESTWLEQDLGRRAEERFSLPVTTLTVGT